LKKILHLDFLADGKDEEYEFALAGQRFYVRRAKIARSIPRLKKLIFHHSEDAVALSGVSLIFYYKGKAYRHRWLHRALKEFAESLNFSDGSLVRETLERYLVLRAINSLTYNFRERRTLIFSALARYGATEVLSGFTKKLIIGDLLYGFRLGVPIFSLSAFDKTAPSLLRTITRAPISWFNPGARTFPRLLPSFRWYFSWAEVILGGMEHFRRYSPKSLPDKVVFTNFFSDADIEFLASKGVATLIGLRPNVAGVRLPNSVLSVAIKLAKKLDKPETELKEEFLNFYLEQRFEPEVVHLKAEQDVEPALIEPFQGLFLEPKKMRGLRNRQRAPETIPSKKPQGILKARGDSIGQESLVIPASDSVSRFSFIIHPLTYEHLLRHKWLKRLDRIFPEGFVERVASWIPPLLVGEIRDIVSKVGARAEGYIFAIPFTSRLMLRVPPEMVYRQILKVCERSAELGAKVVGLGAYTSIVGDAGISVAARSPVFVTSGNSFTVAVTLQTIERCAKLMGVKLSDASLCVIGATGSIGRILSLLMGGKVRKISLVAPRVEKLLVLSDKLRERYPRLEVRVSTETRKCLPEADVVVTTTSAVEPVVDVGILRPGAIVCDVARPPDVSEESARNRPDVLVVESGEVKLPEGTKVTYDLGLPEGIAYACLAETILLALSGRLEHFTVGRSLSEEKVRIIGELGRVHGFELAGIRSFGREISEEQILEVRRRAGLA